MCNFNSGVSCGAGICSKCGWNPEVSKQRVAPLRQQLEKETRDSIRQYWQYSTKELHE